MKLIQVLIVILVLYFFANNSLFAQIPIGSTLPMGDEGMEEVSGRTLALNSISEENGLLVIFISNTCPWVLRWQNRLLDLSAFANDNNIGMVAINPNEGYRERGDDLEDMIRHADKAGYNFPYLLDENHQIADAFGASRTPEVFLFNAALELVYTGAIDDNANNANGVKNSYTRSAIEAMLTGELIQSSTTRLVGCTIKRAS